MIRLQWQGTMARALIASAVILGGPVTGRADGPEAGDRSPYLPEEIRRALGTLADTYDRAHEAMDDDDWRAAAEGFSAILAERPGLAPALLGLASARLDLGELDEAARLSPEAATEEAPAEILLHAGQILGSAAARGAGAGLDAEADALLARAFQRARAEDFASSDDKDRLASVGLLALNHNDEATFRTATARLVRLHPESATGRYLNGIRAAMDGEWVTSKRELNRAVALGLPREAADVVLDAGVRSRANTWLAIYGSANASLAWAGGLLLLFVVGKLLSISTVRSIERDDPNQGITPGQRFLRTTYRRVIASTGLYYYISIPVLVVLALAIAGGLVIGTFMLPTIPVKLVLIVLFFALAMLGMAFSMIRSVFVRVRNEMPGLVLDEVEAPALWELAREVAETVGTRPIDEIRPTDDAELAVTEQGTAREKARDRATRTLILGLNVLPGFRLDAFKAVLAHAYGHFLHRDTAGGDSAMRTNTSMARFAEAMINQGMTAWWNLGGHFLRVYHLLFRRITFGASRLQEIHADRVAVRCYGPESFAEGLRHAIRRSIETDADRSIALDRAASPGTFGAVLDHRESLMQRAAVRRSVNEIFEKIWRAGTSEDDTHPSPVERIRQARRLDDGDPTRAPTAYDAAMAAQPEPTPELHYRRGEALERLGQRDRALGEFAEALRLDPKFAEALVARSRTLARLGRHAEALPDGLEAHRIDPGSPEVRLRLARMHAPCPDPSLRDGRAAVALADRAVQALGEDDRIACDTLAASWAEQGDFKAAVSWAERAVDLAPEFEADACRARLDGYRSGHPFRESIPGGGGVAAPRA